MKKIIVTIILAAFVSSFHGVSLVAQVRKNAGFTLHGNITGLKADVIYLHSIYGNVVDSAKVKDGRFTITGNLDSPVKCVLYTADKAFASVLFMENASITVYGSSENNLIIRGSKAQSEYQTYRNSLSLISNQAKLLEEKLQLAKQKDNKEEISSINKSYDALMAKQMKANTDYIGKHPMSNVSADILAPMIFNEKLSKETLYGLYNELNSSAKASITGKEIKERLGNRFRVYSNYPAPDFTLSDITGKQVKLSGYRGKYVLVDFWASWCGPCRAENPNVLKAYNQYHPKGLEILGVSLDDKKPAWQKAIQEDKLPWTQVSDLKGWKSEPAVLYKVNGIPSDFLINPKGIVVASNLRGEDLMKKLSEIFK